MNIKTMLITTAILGSTVLFSGCAQTSKGGLNTPADFNKEINERFITKFMKSHGIESRTAAINQIIEVESTYKFNKFLQKKGVHKAMNSDKLSLLAISENSYQDTKAIILEKRNDGTIEVEESTNEHGILTKRSKLNKDNSEDIALVNAKTEVLDYKFNKRLIELKENRSSDLKKMTLKIEKKVEEKKKESASKKTSKKMLNKALEKKGN